MKRHSAKQAGSNPVFNTSTSGMPKSVNVQYAKNRESITTPQPIELFGDSVSQEQPNHQKADPFFNVTNPKK